MTPEARREREAVRKARQALRAQGCVCQPDISVLGSAGHAHQVQVAHDDWCPLLRVMEERQDVPGARSQLVLYSKGLGDHA